MWLFLVVLPFTKSSTTTNTYNFGSFITYYCDNEMYMTSSTCDVTITTDILTKTILFRTYSSPKIIRCVMCDIGPLHATKSLHFSMEVMTLDLSNSHISAIPSGTIVGTFKTLILSNNEITKLNDVKIFSRTVQLTALDLSTNRIQSIDERAFFGLPNLKTLWLSFNNIGYLSPRTFSTLQNLHILKLHNNFIRIIEPKLFLRNVLLTELTLNDNFIERIDDLVMEQFNKIDYFDMDNIKYQIGVNSRDYDNTVKWECAAHWEPFTGNQHRVHSEQIAQLSCQQLETIPIEHIQGYRYKYINLRSNEILHIDTVATFNQTPEIIAIDLSYNHIEDISSDAFVGSIHLEQLYLSNNNLTTLSQKTFASLPNLMILHLNDNRLERIDTNLFWHNIQLNILKLNDNDIRFIGDHVFDQLQQLDQLDMSQNWIENEVLISFNAKVANLSQSNVSYLYVGDRVRELYASMNRISSINIGAARSLVSVSLSHNRISKIDFGLQKQLQFVDVSENSLSEIRFTFNADLVHVNVAKNILTEIEFRNVPMLKYLDVSYNSLQSLHLKMPFYLLDLNVSHNQLRSIQNISVLQTVQRLDLSANDIEDWTQLTFQNMDDLRQLYLRNCGVREIFAGWFEHQRKLQLLDISANTLNSIDFKMFYNLENLEDLYLADNNLPDFNENDLLVYFPKLDKIDITENSWTCHRLRPLVGFLRVNSITTIVSTKLNTTDYVTGINGIECIREIDEDIGGSNDTTKFIAVAELNFGIQLKGFHLCRMLIVIITILCTYLF